MGKLIKNLVLPVAKCYQPCTSHGCRGLCELHKGHDMGMSVIKHRCGANNSHRF